MFDVSSKAIQVTLRGHRRAVTCLTFASAQLLLSGASDTDIIIWDLVSQTGITRLQGHKDAVTGLGLLRRPTAPDLVVSSSKDSLLKVWDIDTRTCVQTIVGHRCEVWSLVVVEGEDGGNPRVWTGASDGFLRGYVLDIDEIVTRDAEGQEDILRYYGSVKRKDRERCASLAVDSTGRLLATQSTGKEIELFKIRSTAEVKKKFKRRLKRQRAKVETSSPAGLSVWDESGGQEESVTDGSLRSDRVLLGDELESFSVLACSGKVRGFAFVPAPASSRRAKVRAVASLHNNMLEVYEIAMDESALAARTSVIDLPGHRADIRSVSVSADGLLIATCGQDGVKVWSSRTLACVRTCVSAGLSYPVLEIRYLLIRLV